MIAYRVTNSQLQKLITDESPSWLEKAAERTKEFKKRGCYEEESSIWSQVKIVYMRLQGDCKCVYCERKLESPSFGKYDQDVEHFRPKGNVKKWNIPKALQKYGIKVTLPQKKGGGYFLLPYHPLNYSASCKPCNSGLKKDYFPIAGQYKLKGNNPTTLVTEKPYLICAIGDFDDDPEHLIRFHGVSPQPTSKGGHKRERALVTIEFFRLDDQAKRKNLVRERAAIIVALYPQLRLVTNGGTTTEQFQAQQLIDGFTSPAAPHTNCARSFAALFAESEAEAKAVFDEAVKLIVSIS